MLKGSFFGQPLQTNLLNFVPIIVFCNTNCHVQNGKSVEFIGDNDIGTFYIYGPMEVSAMWKEDSNG